jgi:alginate O-acetyltransferase complex protein AlgI
MTLASFQFLCFFLVVFGLYLATPGRYRWVLLLGASYVFYELAGGIRLLCTLVVVTALSYGVARGIERCSNPRSKQRWLLLGIVLNLSAMVWWKYLPVALQGSNVLLVRTALRLPVPAHWLSVGVSYYVFQGISYLVDVYLEVIDPEHDAGRFALGMAFFPKVLQGPIERSENLLPQLRELKVPVGANLVAGVHLFLWGMFKKTVVADGLAGLVDPVYADVHAQSGVALLLATYLYAFQIYLDFSGYTDMALGVARCFNIRLCQNFNAPYLATSIPEFWRRWHISFSSWILDYIFKPLQIRWRDWRRWGTPLALIVTFLASGLWHGAALGFLAWGAIHGLYMALGSLMPRNRGAALNQPTPLRRMGRVILTFQLVCFAWVFFRAHTFSDAGWILRQVLLDLPRSVVHLSWSRDILLGSAPRQSLEVLFFLFVVLMIGWHERRSTPDATRVGEHAWLSRFPAWAQGTVYGALFYLLAFHGASAQSFIYLQF